VTDQAALDRAVAGTVEALGGIDVVVANAGIASNGTVAVTPVDALARTIEVNLIGVVRTVSATLPHVTERKGYYLLVSSAAALAALPGLSAYAASKAGVEFFGNALRLEVAHKGVDVGVAHPAWIDTDLVRDTKVDLPSFNSMLRTLPGPFGSFTSVRGVRGGVRRRPSSGAGARCSCRSRWRRSPPCGRSCRAGWRTASPGARRAASSRGSSARWRRWGGRSASTAWR
jgi:NAD(P)-dependent dehydrogenase (short-subunit alcohol dehydrogenase family)